MGLLDNLYFGHNSNFGGQGGGLLDFLRTTQMQQENYQPSTGFPGQASPIAVGDYQMPRIGDQAQFTPPPTDPAALPPNAQPAQGQLPMQPPQQQGFGGFLEGLNENFQNMGNGGSIIGALTGQRPNNQTAQFLVSKGIDPALAKTIVSDPALLRSVLPQVMGTGGQTDDIKEFDYAQKNPAFAKYMESKRAGAGEVSLNPVWGEDGKGNPVLGQLNKRGEFVQTKLPPGVTPSKGVDKVDLGTEWGVLSKVNGQLVGRYPKDIVGKERAEEVGKAQGIAGAALPAVEMTARTTIDQIDKFMESKGFNEVFGVLDQFRPNFTMSDAGRDALAKFKQLSGRAFLEGRSMLKGGGAITDFESNKAESAIARLDRSQNENDAKAALEDFKSAVREGAAKLRATAGGGAAPATAAATPSAAAPSGAIPEGATATNPQTGQKITFRNGKWQ